MQYVIIGVDAPSFDSVDALHEAHQDYMDRWSGALVARGPSLDVDGRHTGSIHVIDLPDFAAANRFAQREPYFQAGWYAELTVSGILPCTEGTMWDRPAPAMPLGSAMVTATVDGRVTAAELVTSLRRRLDASADPWLYVGVPCDGMRPSGLIALVDKDPADACQSVSALLAGTAIADAPLESQHWRRGGR